MLNKSGLSVNPAEWIENEHIIIDVSSSRQMKQQALKVLKEESISKHSDTFLETSLTCKST